MQTHHLQSLSLTGSGDGGASDEQKSDSISNFEFLTHSQLLYNLLQLVNVSLFHVLLVLSRNTKTLICRFHLL